MRSKFQFAVPLGMKQVIQLYADAVNWSAVCRAAVARKVREIRRIERRATGGRGRKRL